MPDENGLDLMPRIRKLRPELRVIVMSAQNTLLTAVQGGRARRLRIPAQAVRPATSWCRSSNRALSAPAASMPRGSQPPEADERLPLIGRSPAMQEIYRADRPADGAPT